MCVRIDPLTDRPTGRPQQAPSSKQQAAISKQASNIDASAAFGLE
jgi:hypothetical protein